MYETTERGERERERERKRGREVEREKERKKERERDINESDFLKSVSGRFEPTTPA